MGRSRRGRGSAASNGLDQLRASFPYPVHYDTPGPPFPSTGSQHAHSDTPLLSVDPSETGMLGTYASVSLWMSRIARGRGATVCTDGILSDLSEMRASVSTPSFRCVLDCAEHISIPLTFHGPHAAALHQILRNHAPGIRVFVSGYGAEVVRATQSPPRAGLIFAERMALKALLGRHDGDTLTLWFEGDRGRPATLVMQPVSMTNSVAHGMRDAPIEDVARDNRSRVRADIPPSSLSHESAASVDDRPSPLSSDPAPVLLQTKVMDLARPGTLDGVVYTPLSDVQIGTTANVIGVVIDKPIVHQPKGRTDGTMSDAMLRVAMQPPKSWDTGTTLLAANLFARTVDQLPTHLLRGDAFLLRNLQIQMYHGKAHGVGPAFVPYSWASCRSPQEWNLSPGAHLGVEERTALAQIVHHATPTSTKSSHPLVSLDALQSNSYVDMVVEIVRVSIKGRVPDLYVTDYLPNRQFYGHDTLLAHHHKLPKATYGHLVFQIGLWGEKASSLSFRLRPGQLVRINNVRVKTNALGTLHGSLGNSLDDKAHVEELDHRDPLAQCILQRRSAWLQQQQPRNHTYYPQETMSADAKPWTSSPAASSSSSSPAPVSKKKRLSSVPSSPTSSLPPASLLPASPPEPVSAPRFDLDSDDSESCLSL